MAQPASNSRSWVQSNPGIAVVVILFLLLTVISLYQALWKVTAISWIAFAAMALALPFGKRHPQKETLSGLIAGYGLSSGAMITSACIFLVPSAIGHHPVYGGFGIAFGVMAGYAIHTLTHNLTHHTAFTEPVVLELSVHALMAGLIIGSVYAAMPELGLLLGIAIVSHKSPAGYAAARRLARREKGTLQMLIPSCAIGLTALPVSMLSIPENAITNALIFGFATGVFIHVAIDFLPECEIGGEIFKHADQDSISHHKLDFYRKRAVLTTFAGGLLVLLAWSLFH